MKYSIEHVITQHVLYYYGSHCFFLLIFRFLDLVSILEPNHVFCIKCMIKSKSKSYIFSLFCYFFTNNFEIQTSMSAKRYWHPESEVDISGLEHSADWLTLFEWTTKYEFIYFKIWITFEVLQKPIEMVVESIWGGNK